MTKRIHIRLFASILFLLIITSCDPLVNQFSSLEPAVLYEARHIQDSPTKNALKIMTWNIRFGAARISWFGDECGNRVILKKSEVVGNLEALAEKIKLEDPDILLLQEVDVESKRTAYVDQVQWLLNNTNFNYGAFASMWESQVILADGLGRVNTGNAILSKWKLKDAERHQLPLRGDQDNLTKYFYLRRNVLKVRVVVPNRSEFYAVCVHATAFATDDTKQKHLRKFKDILDGIVADGGNFVAGGDLNAIPPNATKTDFCLEDQCAGESYHGPEDEPRHKEGSFFDPEITWLNPLYNQYFPAVSLAFYGLYESKHHTHSPGQKLTLDRKLDYLWTNVEWVSGSAVTHQEATALSDHIPVSAVWVIPQ